MKNFNNYSIADYLSDSTFKEWVMNNGINDNKSEWYIQIHSNPQQLVIATNARYIILASGIEAIPIDDVYTEAIVSNTLSKIAESKQLGKSFNLKNWHFPIGIAASLILLLIAGWFYVRLTKEKDIAVLVEQKQTATYITFYNTSNKIIPIALSDGSSILLDPNSQIKYPNTFASNERIVELSGSAFFEVTKNPLKPFLVKSEEMTTKVIGTSFRVNANHKNSAFSVMVKSGKVSVYAEDNEKHKSIELTPNEEVVFTRSNQTLVKKAIKSETIEKSTPENIKPIVFEDVPINQIIESLSENYKVPIKINGSKLMDCSLTTIFKDEPLFEKIKIICQAIGPSTSFTTEGGEIIIITKGCNN